MTARRVSFTEDAPGLQGVADPDFQRIMTVFGYIAIMSRRRIPAVVQFLVRLR
jgi:hypothetical protein